MLNMCAAAAAEVNMCAAGRSVAAGAHEGSCGTHKAPSSWLGRYPGIYPQ